MTTFSKIEDKQIAALTKRILSNWEKEEKQTPISKERIKDLETVGVYRFESEEHLAEHKKYEDDDNQLKNRLNKLNDCI